MGEKCQVEKKPVAELHFHGIENNCQKAVFYLSN
jgi:hypothetical protein